MTDPQKSSIRWQTRMSIRTKLLISIISAVLLFGSFHVYVVFRIVHTALEEEFLHTGIVLTRRLAYQVEEAVLYNDEGSIKRLLWQWKSDAAADGYALIVSANGEVIESTFVDGVPTGIGKANLPTGSEHQIKRVLIDEVAYLDVAVPLAKGSAVWVRLGFSEEPVRIPARKILTVLLGMILFYGVLGLIGTVFFSRIITSPIRKMVGGISTVDLNSEPVKLGIHTGDELEILATSFEDMTVRLQHSHKQLSEAQKLAVLGMLASGIAHEINSPLAAIELRLKRIGKDSQTSEHILGYLPTIMDSIKHMQGVIQQILLFARPEELQLTSASPGKLVDKALALVHHKLIEHNIHVTSKSVEEENKVWTDPQKLTQILVNLMINAINAMPRGGDLVIETIRNEGRVHITVTDTGCGIERKNLEKIWEPFYTTNQGG